MPARAPASIDILHTVIRPSIVSARMTGPSNSIAWPVPPAVPILPMIASTTSLALQAVRQCAFDPHPHGFRLLREQALGRQHVLDFRGADAEGETAEGAMRARMGVAADNRHARQGRALFGPDHMDDPLARIAERKVRLDSMLAHVGVELVDLHAGGRVGDAQLPVRRRRVVIGRGDHRLETPGFAAREPQTLECLRAVTRAPDCDRRKGARPARLVADDVGFRSCRRRQRAWRSDGTKCRNIENSVKRAPRNRWSEACWPPTRRCTRRSARARTNRVYKKPRRCRRA